MINTLNIDISKFNLKEEYFETHSWLHGIKHTYRVMCNCLVLGDKLGLTRETKLAFFGAFIHDMGRQHDGYCTEHGRWAIELKFDNFKDLFIENGVNLNDLEEIKTAVINHSMHPDISKDHPHYTTTAILKDADALDRIRMGRFNLNKKFLRFQETIELISYARKLYYKTRNSNGSGLSYYLNIADQILKNPIT